jgi:hypothetical protein
VEIHNPAAQSNIQQPARTGEFNDVRISALVRGRLVAKNLTHIAPGSVAVPGGHKKSSRHARPHHVRRAPISSSLQVYAQRSPKVSNRCGLFPV